MPIEHNIRKLFRRRIMHSNQSTKDNSSQKIALLIDADNISHEKISHIIAELSKHGAANIRRAYGDWTSKQLKGWETKLHEFAIRPIQQFSYSTGKNATDIALVIDAMELLYTQKPDAFCIASSDADFTPLVMQLKSNGVEVYGFGERKTPEPFVNACTAFLFLDSFKEEPEPKAKRTAKTVKSPTKAMPELSDPKKAQTPLSQDTKLVAILRGAIAASLRDDGWAAMSAAGSATKRQAPIDPRNYGVRNFTALFEKVDLFKIHKSENGQIYVADKRNPDCSQIPES